MPESANRAFLYGESVFTTMRLMNHHLVDWEYHFERLKQGVDFLYGPFNDEEDWGQIFRQRLEDRLGLEGDKVVRVTIYREQQSRGLVRTGRISVNELKIAVSATPYEAPPENAPLLSFRTCGTSQRPNWWPAFLKAGNYLETILAQKKFLQPGDDDLLFLNSSDCVLESSVANIFVVKHDKLYTAPTGPNVLDGIMRRKVIEAAPTFFDSVEEVETSYERLIKADAVFGTNSIRGPFLIGRIDDHDFNYDQTFLEHFAALRKKVF